MAGEGLKFTGQVVLSNRDLIKEAQDREVFKEQRLLFQQGQEDREVARKKARNDRNKELYGDFQYAGDIRPEYTDYLQGEVKSYRDWVSENYEALMDGDLDIERERINREQKLNDTVNILKSRTADYSTITQDIKSNITNANLYNRIDDKYAYEVNEEQFLKNLSEGNFSPDGLSLDLGVVKNTPQQSSSAIFAINKWMSQNKPEKEEIGDKYITKSYTEEQKRNLLYSLETNLHPDNIGMDSGYYNDYMNEEAQMKFLEEKYNSINRNPEELDPNSEVYDKATAVEYSIWRAENITKKASAFPTQTGIIKDKDKGFKLTDKDVLAIEAPSEEDLDTVQGVPLKKSNSYSVSVKNITISNPTAKRGWDKGVKLEDETIKADLIEVRVTSDNEPVGVMYYEDTEDGTQGFTKVDGKLVSTEKKGKKSFFIIPLEELEAHLRNKGEGVEKLLAYTKRGKKSGAGSYDFLGED